MRRRFCRKGADLATFPIHGTGMVMRGEGATDTKFQDDGRGMVHSIDVLANGRIFLVTGISLVTRPAKQAGDDCSYRNKVLLRYAMALPSKRRDASAIKHPYGWPRCHPLPDPRLGLRAPGRYRHFPDHKRQADPILGRLADRGPRRLRHGRSLAIRPRGGHASVPPG